MLILRWVRLDLRVRDPLRKAVSEKSVKFVRTDHLPGFPDLLDDLSEAVEAVSDDGKGRHGGLDLVGSDMNHSPISFLKSSCDGSGFAFLASSWVIEYVSRILRAFLQLSAGSLFLLA